MLWYGCYLGINNRWRILLDCTVTVFEHEPQSAAIQNQQLMNLNMVTADLQFHFKGGETLFFVSINSDSNLLKGGETPFLVSINSDSKYDLLLFIIDGKRL